MSKLITPDGYKPVLSIYETQKAIGLIKQLFQDNLSAALNIKRVSAPLFVEPQSGFNDDLDGVQRPVSFDIPHTDSTAQIVQSLAKWKRIALHKYGFPVGEGIYADMNGIRRDDPDMDNLHSVYVDQWDWEKIIGKESRNLNMLKETVKNIVSAICITQEQIKFKFPALNPGLSSDVSFITAQELENLYPELSYEEREREYAKDKKTIFIMQIGDILNSGQTHGSRAPDYDDWTLNGDIIFWSDILNCAVELSSMGIRVDAKALDEQLEKADCNHRRGLLYHKMLLNGELPLTIGGGIGQSRLCMLLLEKAHIGEVQVSVWDDATIDGCAAAGIELL